MQKIVKDILSDLQKEKHVQPVLTKCPKRQIPQQTSITDFETLVNLIYYKEIAETKAMTDILQQKLLTEGKKFYDVWMYEISDNIQAMALAYAERFCLEAAIAKMNSSDVDQAVKNVLQKAIRLHCLLYVKENLGWYLAEGVVSPQAGKAFDDDYQSAVKDLLPHVNDILEGFNIPKVVQLAPSIIRDYVKFNEMKTDVDDVNAAGDYFDYKKGPKL